MHHSAKIQYLSVLVVIALLVLISSTSTSSSCQTPEYLPANIPCKKGLLEINRSNLKEFKHLKKLFYF